MQNTILIDAGPLIALFDRDDNYHKRVVDFIKDSHWQFVTTTAVMTEVSYMLNFNVKAQLDFFEWIVLKGVTLFELEQYDMARVIHLTKEYRDLPMDFADATLIIAAENMGIRTIISIDSDFDIYRLPGKILVHNIFPR
jgi:predicted nucleic acid-binding protein